MRRRSLLLPAVMLAVLFASAPTHAQPRPGPCRNDDPSCTSFPGPVGIQTEAPSAALEVADGNIKISRPRWSPAKASLLLSHAGAPMGTGFWRFGLRESGTFGITNLTLNKDSLRLMPNGDVLMPTGSASALVTG